MVNETKTTAEPLEDETEQTGMTHTIRHGDGGTIEIKNYTRTLAIKLMCSECMGFESDVKGCTDFKCPLFPFRGKKICTFNRIRYDEEDLKRRSEEAKKRMKEYHKNKQKKEIQQEPESK